MTGPLVFVVILLAICNGWLAYSLTTLRRRLYLFLDRTTHDHEILEGILKDREKLATIEEYVSKHGDYIEILGRAMKEYESQTGFLAKRKEEKREIQNRFISRSPR
jgi:hypothetical protein